MHRKTVDEYRARTSGEKEPSDTLPSDSDGHKSYSRNAFAMHSLSGLQSMIRYVSAVIPPTHHLLTLF